MNTEQLEQLAKLHAQISDIYEAAAAGDDAKPAKGKGKPAATDDDDDLPPPSKAGTTGKAAAKTPAKKTAAKAPVEDDEPSEDDVVNAAKELIQATDKATAVKIIKKFGGAKVADLDESVYGKVIAALKAAMPAGEDEGDTDDDI